MLPDVVPYATIEAVRAENEPLSLPIGIAEADLRPVLLDFAGPAGSIAEARTQAGTFQPELRDEHIAIPASMLRAGANEVRLSLLRPGDSPELTKSQSRYRRTS